MGMRTGHTSAHAPHRLEAKGSGMASSRPRRPARGWRRSDRNTPSRTRGRPSGGRPDRCSGRRRSARSAAPPRRARRRAAGCGRCPRGRRGPLPGRRARPAGGGPGSGTRSCRWAGPVAAAGGELQEGRQVLEAGHSFSMPTSATWTRGSDVERRMLPSFSMRARVPVSAARKFAPEMPRSAARKSSRRAARAAAARASGIASGAVPSSRGRGAGSRPRSGGWRARRCGSAARPGAG